MYSICIYTLLKAEFWSCPFCQGRGISRLCAECAHCILRSFEAGSAYYVTAALSLTGKLINVFKKQNIAKVLHIDSNQFHNTEPFSIGVSITVITVPGLILFIVPSGSTAACGFRQSSIWHRVTGGRNSTRRLLNCLLAKTCVGFLFSFPVVRLSPFMQIVNGSKDPCVEELQTSKWRHNLEQLMHFLPKWDDFLWSILISFYSFN